MELIDTIEDMLSEDYKERFKAEYNQLIIRQDKLASFLNSYDNLDTNNKTITNFRVLHAQLNIMRAYINILRVRAEIEGIYQD